MEDVLKNYYKSPLVYKNVDCFTDENVKLVKKMALYFKYTNKDNILTEEDEEDYRKINTCRFCEKKIFLIK